MPFLSLVAWPRSAPCLPYCFDNQAPDPPVNPSIACTISCVSERNTTAWSLSAARIPDILADAFRVVIVQDFEGIAVEDRDDEAMILKDSANKSRCQEGEEHTQRPYIGKRW